MGFYYTGQWNDVDVGGQLGFPGELRVRRWPTQSKETYSVPRMCTLPPSPSRHSCKWTAGQALSLSPLWQYNLHSVFTSEQLSHYSSSPSTRTVSEALGPGPGLRNTGLSSTVPQAHKEAQDLWAPLRSSRSEPPSFGPALKAIPEAPPGPRAHSG